MFCSVYLSRYFFKNNATWAGRRGKIQRGMVGSPNSENGKTGDGEMNRRKFLAKVVCVSGGVVLAKFAQAQWNPDGSMKEYGINAPVCKKCADMKRHTYCLICKEPSCCDFHRYHIARLCFRPSCGSGKNRCVFCGNEADSEIKGRVCTAHNTYFPKQCYKCGHNT